MKIKSLFVLFLGVLSMTVNAKELTRDEAQIRSNINSYAALADQAAFEHLGRLFAPELVVDYTSLFGGEPATVKREVLMGQWAGFLPGFDTTYHELSNLKVDVNGDKADASVDFTASHWVGAEGYWKVSGSYDFTLVRAHDNWEITSVKVNGGDEKGSRDVLGEAPKNAVENLKARNDLLVSYK
ncbi:nuclear transport factor 2 family protein [Vibrio sp. HN007]|uniref:nuclear transport factor 2 family protein n=1 Tax=Vibrio iocasae TaxID=3098914 RepID=UPI0035D4D31E